MDSTLTETLRDLAGAASVAIESIKINSVNREIRDGRTMWLKRRKPGSEFIAVLANLFFRLARARIHVWVNPGKWQRWEVLCFHLLHDPGFRAFAEGARTVCADKVPGISLLEHVNHGTLTTSMLEAAAREFRRVHELWCVEFGDLWSHGDPLLNNVIYEPAANRARLIDFEVAHERSLSAVARHGDDLLAFLQDMVGRVSAEQWLPFALCFIKAYDRPEVTAELRKHLIVPRGFSGLWWKLRTHYLDREELVCRFGALARALDRSLKRQVTSTYILSAR
jgi:hypothetical protein